MMFSREQARTQSVTAQALIRRTFSVNGGESALDAVFLSAGREAALGFWGLPYRAPICAYLLNVPAVAAYIERFPENQLFRLTEGRLTHETAQGENTLPDSVAQEIR